MTREQIEQWAGEAGGGFDDTFESASRNEMWLFTPAELERFAALVAAHEREQCALVCEAKDLDPYVIETPTGCAAAIRARGEGAKT